VVRVAVRAEATAEEVSVAAMPAELPASFHPVSVSLQGSRCCRPFSESE
jgi:hypothetical protein